MIAFIRGTVADITEDSIILETNGVGYRIFVPGSVQSQAVVGRELKLHTYLSVREDAMNLYGFSSKDDLKVFKLLITVNGIGPKGGLAILSVMSSNDLRYAVMAGDSKAIAKAPGVGSKTAQKIILELKDRLHIEDVFATEDIKPAAGGAGDHTDIINEAVMALAALGYSQTDAMKAVHKCEITDTTTVEELLKLALKKII